MADAGTHTLHPTASTSGAKRSRHDNSNDPDRMDTSDSASSSSALVNAFTELERWFKSKAVHNHYNTSLSRLRSLLHKQKKAQQSVEKLEQHSQLGTTPPSLRVKNKSPVAFSAEFSNKTKELRTQYEKELVKLTLEARQQALKEVNEEIDNFRATQTKFLDDMINAERSLIEALRGIVKASPLPNSQYTSFFFGKLDEGIREMISTLAASDTITQIKKQKEQARQMSIEENIHQQPLEKSVSDLIKAEVTKQLKASKAQVRFQSPKSPGRDKAHPANGKQRPPARKPQDGSTHRRTGEKNKRNHSESRSTSRPKSTSEASRSRSSSHPKTKTEASRSRSTSRSRPKNWSERHGNQGPGGRAPGKYIPPHLRANTSKPSGGSSTKPRRN